MRECLWVSNKFPDNDYKKGGIPPKKFLFYVFWQKKSNCVENISKRKKGL